MQISFVCLQNFDTVSTSLEFRLCGDLLAYCRTSFLARASLHWHVQEHEAEEIVSSTCCPLSFAGQSRGEYILQNGKIGVTTFGESSGLFPVKQMLWWVVRKERADSSLC